MAQKLIRYIIACSIVLNIVTPIRAKHETVTPNGYNIRDIVITCAAASVIVATALYIKNLYGTDNTPRDNRENEPRIDTKKIEQLKKEITRELLKKQQLKKKTCPPKLKQRRKKIKKEKTQEDVYQACKNGNFEAVRSFVDQYPQMIDAKRMDRQCDYDFFEATLLYIACENNNIEIVRYLLNKGAGVDIQNGAGKTPLYIASLHRYNGIVSLLLNKNADVNIADNYGVTPAHVACSRGYLDIVKMLVENGADVEAGTSSGSNSVGRTVLQTAVFSKKNIIAEYLLQEANAQMKDYRGESLLHFACRNGDYETAQVLIEDGNAQVNEKGSHGDTPLTALFRSHHFNDETANLLLEKGANINDKNDDKQTPLALAYCKKSMSSCEFLLSRGAIADADTKEHVKKQRDIWASRCWYADEDAQKRMAEEFMSNPDNRESWNYKIAKFADEKILNRN